MNPTTIDYKHQTNLLLKVADAIQIRTADTELAVIREFDTIEHAQYGLEQLVTNPTNMAVLKMFKLMRDKQAEKGYSYTYDYKVLP